LCADFARKFCGEIVIVAETKTILHWRYHPRSRGPIVLPPPDTGNSQGSCSEQLNELEKSEWRVGESSKSGRSVDRNPQKIGSFLCCHSKKSTQSSTQKMSVNLAICGFFGTFFDLRRRFFGSGLAQGWTHSILQHSLKENSPSEAPLTQRTRFPVHKSMKLSDWLFFPQQIHEINRLIICPCPEPRPRTEHFTFSGGQKSLSAHCF
jgi:hypothetical protein